MIRRLLLACLLFATAVSGAAAYKSFWLTESVSGLTVGPIVSRPGNVFTVGGAQWRIHRCDGREIVFESVGGNRTEGPYDLVEQRLLDLGPAAYVFTRITDFVGSDPTVDRSVVSQARRAAAPGGRAAAGGDRPQRWVLGPVPSTNPGAHKDAVKPWSLHPFSMAPTVSAFLDLYRSVEYDWSVSSVAKSHDSAIRLIRLGAEGEWNGLRAEAGLSFNGSASDALVADSLELSRLRLNDADGWFARIGYDYGFVIDEGWSVSVGVEGSYESLSGRLSAHTTQPAESADDGPAESTETSGEDGERIRSYGFHSWHGDLSLDEFRLTAGVGLRYDQWYWGLGAKFLLDCLTDVSTGVRIPVLDDSHELKAERTMPVSLLFQGWYSPDDHWVIQGGLSVGSDTMLRIGAGWFF